MISRSRMLSDNAGQRRRSITDSRYQPGVIGSVVQRGADVVAHATVDADVRRCAVLLTSTSLTVPTSYNVMVPGRRWPVRARPPASASAAHRGRLVADDGAQLGRQFAHRRWIIGCRYEMPRPHRDPRRDLRGLLDAELGDDLLQQADDTVRGELEAATLEYLRTDVAVQTDQPKVIGANTGVLRRRSAAGDRQPELWSSCAVEINSWVCASTRR